MYLNHKNLTIRLFRESDSAELYDLVDSSRATLNRWLEFPQRIQALEDCQEFIHSIQAKYQKHEGFWAGIWIDDTLVGSIGLLSIDARNKKTEIGYWLGSQHEGNGYMLAACKLMIGHIFAELGLNRIEIRVKSGNSRSQRIPSSFNSSMRELYGKPKASKEFIMTSGYMACLRWIIVTRISEKSSHGSMMNHGCFKLMYYERLDLIFRIIIILSDLQAAVVMKEEQQIADSPILVSQHQSIASDAI